MAEPTEAAVAVAANMVSELIEKVPAAPDEPDRLRSDLAQLRGVEATQGSSGQEEPVAEPVQHETEPEPEEPEAPDLEPELPEDLAAFLDEPDFVEEAELEIETEEPTYSEYTATEDETEERRKRIALEKKNVWLEERLATQNRGKWEAEEKKYFPLAELAKDALKQAGVPLAETTSRRAYLRQSRQLHEAFKPLVAKIDEAASVVKAEARAEGRQASEAAWGKPTSGPGTVPQAITANNSEMEAARATGSLQKVIKVMREQAAKRR